MSVRLPEGGLRRGPLVEIEVDGAVVPAYLGESVAAALLVDGADDLATRTTRGGAPRGLYCGMGVCFDCLVVVDGVPNTRACVTWVRAGMVVTRQGARGRDAHNRTNSEHT